MVISRIKAKDEAVNSVSFEINSIAATDQPNRVVAALWDGRVAIVSLTPEARP